MKRKHVKIMGIGLLMKFKMGVVHSQAPFSEILHGST
jgi:hypothetical protein